MNDNGWNEEGTDLSQPNVAGESDYGLRDESTMPEQTDEAWEDTAPVSDEVVGEIKDDNGEVLEVHLVKPAESSKSAPKSDFSLGKYGKYGVVSRDPRVFDKGPEVERLLSSLGMGGDTFTPEVADQVKQVQEEKGLPVTGFVDRLTWDAITQL